MSYNSSRTVTSMVSGLVLLGMYIMYAVGGRAPAGDDFQGWAIALLVFIGAGIVLQIIIQILFHIALAVGIAVKERGADDKEIERRVTSATVEDERDRLIALKAGRIGSFFTGAGIVAFLVVLAVGGAPVLGLHIILGIVSLGTIVEGAVTIFFHEKGLSHV